jgi:hypothetical protein
LLEITRQELLIIINALGSLGMDVDETDYGSILGASVDEVRKLMLATKIYDVIKTKGL